MLKRLALAASAVVFALVVAEVAYRVWLYSVDCSTRAAFESIDDPPKLRPGEDAAFGQLVRRAKQARIVYELLPNLRDVPFIGVPVSTDGYGFRQPERPLAKPPRALRIVGLGDSAAFGWGVPEPTCMFRRLEGLLRQRFPDRQVDVINTAVPGYNTAMEVATLEAKGLQFQPDAVIIDYVGNDIDLPNMIWRERNYFTPWHSYLAAGIIRGLREKDPWAENWYDGAPAHKTEDRFENEPDRVPAAYRDMVGPAGYRRAMERLVELGRQHHFYVLVTAHWDTGPLVEKTCQDLGLPLVCSWEPLHAHMKERGIANYLGSELSLSDKDPHPSSLNHEIHARNVFRVLESSGVLKLWEEQNR